MMQKMYIQDPNEYIKSLSQVRKSIQKIIPLKLKSSSNRIGTEIERQIAQNYAKYKKNILINKRIKLSKQHHESVQKQKKIYLQQLIANKIKVSEQARESNKRQIVQHKKVQRLMKQAINLSKKQQIRKSNIQRSLQIIEKNERSSKSYSRLPVKLRMLEQQIKSSKMVNNAQNQQGIRNRVSSQHVLPKLYKSVQFSQSKQKNDKQIKTRSDINLNAYKVPQVNNEEQILSKLIQENQMHGYADYVIRNSLSYRALNHSYHKEIKQAIETFLESSNQKNIL